MNPLLIIIIVIFSTIGAAFLLYIAYLCLVYLAVSKRINLRYDRNPLLKYFTYEDFPGLKAEAFEFKTRNKKTLKGYIYTTEDVKDFSKVIVFFHGIGPGHLAYSKEINRLVRENNLAVIAYDNHGTGLSEGKNIIDLSWALVDADYFLKYSQKDPRFAHSDLILVGHSWGGYVTSNIYSLNRDKRIKKIVVLNGLPSIVDVSTRFTKGQTFAKQFFRFVSYLKLGKYANHAILDTLMDHKLPALVVHGALDPLVPIQYLTPLFKFAGKVSYIRPLIYAEHRHFVYLSLQAEEALMTMQRELKRLEKDQDALKAYTASLDYDLIGQHHEQLFVTIKQFINRG